MIKQILQNAKTNELLTAVDAAGGEYERIAKSDHGHLAVVMTDHDDLLEVEEALRKKYEPMLNEDGCLSSVEHLYEIGAFKLDWMLQYNVDSFQKNSEKEIQIRTENAISTLAAYGGSDITRALDIIADTQNGLYGCGTALTSAIFTLYDERKYPIIDNHALSTLNRYDVNIAESPANADYGTYTRLLQRICELTTCETPREVDKRLWALDKRSDP